MLDYEMKCHIACNIISLFPSNIAGAMNTAVRGGIQNFIRSILPNAFGNVTSVQTNQTGKQHILLLVEHEND